MKMICLLVFPSLTFGITIEFHLNISITGVAT